MSKTVYTWNDQMIFDGTKLVDDDHMLGSNETFDALPQPNLMPAKWGGTGWVSATQEEHDAYLAEQQKAMEQMYPELVASDTPSAGDKALNALGLQLAEVQKAQATTNAAVNALGLQIASLKSTDKATTNN